MAKKKIEQLQGAIADFEQDKVYITQLKIKLTKIEEDDAEKAQRLEMSERRIELLEEALSQVKRESLHETRGIIQHTSAQDLQHQQSHVVDTSAVKTFRRYFNNLSLKRLSDSGKREAARNDTHMPPVLGDNARISVDLVGLTHPDLEAGSSTHVSGATEIARVGSKFQFQEMGEERPRNWQRFQGTAEFESGVSPVTLDQATFVHGPTDLQLTEGLASGAIEPVQDLSSIVLSDLYETKRVRERESGIV